MKGKHIYFFLAMLLSTTGLYAQLGIKAGVNMASEIKSFSQADIAAGFNSKNLTGYQVGLVYQAMPKKSGLGIEIGALLSQKGSTFHFDSTSVSNTLKEGYKEINYVEVPFNVRYRISLGFLGIYGFGGIYGGYALSAKTVEEISNAVETASFTNVMDRIDYGYNFGAGIELFRKIHFGATWSQGIKDINITSAGLPTATKTTNRVLSFNLVYLF
jgi:hypothetical protein